MLLIIWIYIASTNGIQITAKKTSQPMGLLYRVPEGKSIVVEDIANIKESPFHIGDHLVKFKGKKCPPHKIWQTLLGAQK